MRRCMLLHQHVNIMQICAHSPLDTLSYYVIMLGHLDAAHAAKGVTHLLHVRVPAASKPLAVLVVVVRKQQGRAHIHVAEVDLHSRPVVLLRPHLYVAALDLPSRPVVQQHLQHLQVRICAPPASVIQCRASAAVAVVGVGVVAACEWFKQVGRTWPS